MIIHSPIISGSLTFADGSTFTLPDGGNYSGSFSGSIQISEVQSHLIPDTDVTYDLGSADNRFRDIYLSDGTIRLKTGKIGISGGSFSLKTNDDIFMPLGVSTMGLNSPGLPSLSLASSPGGFTLKDADDEPAPMIISRIELKSTSSSTTNSVIQSNSIGGGVSFLDVDAAQCVRYRIRNNDNIVNLFYSYTDCDGTPVTGAQVLAASTDTVTFQQGTFQRTSGTDNYDITLFEYVGAEASPIEVAKLTVTGSAGGGTIVSTDTGIKVVDPVDETQPGQVELATITLTNEGGTAGTKVTANAGTGQVSFTDLFDEPVGLIAEQITIPPASGSSSTTTTVIRQKETAEGGGVSFFEVSSSQCARYRIINHSVQQNLFFNYTDCDGNPVSSAQILTSTSDVVTMQMGSFQRTGGGSDHYDIKLLDYVNADYAVAEIKQLEISTTGSSDNIVIRLDDTDDSGTPKLILTVSGSDAPADLQTGNIVVSGSNGTSTITNDLPGEGLAVTDATGSLTPIKAKTFELEDPDTGDIITLSVSSGSLNTTATNSSGSSIPNPKSNLSGSFTGSLGLTGDITSEADCVKIGTELNPICDIYATRITGSLSGTVNGINIVDVKANVDAILASSDADKDSFAEIVNLINSVDTTNDSVFAGFVTSSNNAQGVQDGRLTALEIETGSIATAQSVQDGRLDTLESTLNGNTNGYVLQNGDADLSALNVLGTSSFDDTINGNSIILSNGLTADGAILSDNYVSAPVIRLQGVGFQSADNGRIDGSGVRIGGLGDEKFEIDEYGNTTVAGTLSIAGVSNVSASIASNTLAISELSTDYNDLQNIPVGIVSGSSQIDVTATTNYSTVSSHISSSSNPHSVTKAQVGLGNADNTSDADKPISTATQNALDLKATVSDLNTEKGRIDAILTGSQADKDSFAEIVSLINSVDTTNDTAFAGFVNSSNAAQAVQDGRLDTLENTVGNLSTDYGDLENIPVGIVSSSAQISNYNTFLEINGDSVVSGSATQVRSFLNVENGATADQTAGEIKTAYESNSNTNAFTDALLSKINGIEAGATADQTAEEIQDIVGGMVSTNTESGISVTYDDTAGKLNFSVTTQSDNNFTTALKSKLDGIESGANVTDAANVDAAGAVMNSDTSTAAMSFVIDEDAMTSNTATKVPTQQSVKTYVDNKVSTLIDSAPGALDTLNELAAALGDDANFSTTVTNSLATKANSSVTISTGNGLSGGGNLTANRTLSMSGTYTGTFAVTGGITATADVIAYASSDRRLKDNIVNIENPIEKVQKLNGVTWEWNDNADELQKSTPTVGVIAQEVEEVLPQLVNTRDNGYKAVDYAKLTGLLIEAVKEQQKQIDELKSRLG